MIDKGILVECVTKSTVIVPQQIHNPVRNVRGILSRNYPELECMPIPLDMTLDIFKKVILIRGRNNPDKVLIPDFLNQFDVYFIDNSFNINIYCDDDNDRSYLLNLLSMSGYVVSMYKSSPVFKTHLQLYDL